MSHEPHPVAFVAAGNLHETETYRNLAHSYAVVLESKREPHSRFGESSDDPLFSTAVFDTPADALAHLSKLPYNGGRYKGTLAILSSAFGREADEISAKHQDIRVITFTGADPIKGRRIIVAKEWVNNGNLAKIIEG